MWFNKKIIIACLLLPTQYALAHGPIPSSLKGAPIPPVPGLLDGSSPIVVNQAKAIALGKALFWDMAVGSDGMACASCHFHAGADQRVKNQLDPGHRANSITAETFEPLISGATGGPNYTLHLSDFPFHQRDDVFNQASNVIFNTDDMVSSAGPFGRTFQAVKHFGSSNDNCTQNVDSVFQVNNIGTRRIVPRNTPSVINAVFNHRNFWDGRANNVFNGSSPWGDRDLNAGVWVKINGRTVQKQKLQLINSALASQALAPTLSDVEMSCQHRTFSDIGRKLLMRRPLEHQKVHFQDSVLAPYSSSSQGNLQQGLNTSYGALVRAAFNRKYWSYRRRGPFGAPASGLPYTQMEANFSLFFGLAIQLYESTLISDDAPIDRATRDPVTYLPTDLGDSVKRGMAAFEEFHCNVCHSGPTLTANAIITNAQMLEDNPTVFNANNFFQGGSNGVAINRNVVNYDSALGSKFFDTGFANTGVQDPSGDPGVNGTDDFGNPLSYADQYAEFLAGTPNAIIDTAVGIEAVKSCNFQSLLATKRTFPFAMPQFFTNLADIIPDPNGTANCFNLGSLDAFIPTQTAAAAELANPISKKMAFATQAAFKIPSLRNVELTGPYMHNGGMATLEQVIEFYSRGGNFPNKFTHEFVTSLPLFGTDPVINAATIQKRKDIIAFLKSLTDDRVRYERAPFDHPELIVPNGHVGNEVNVTAGNPLGGAFAKDILMTIPAVGATGNTAPLQAFKDVLAP
ncbi:MAG: cytochrome c peroxidase [Methylococcales bacterium]